MRYFQKDAPRISFATPSTKTIVLGVVTLGISMIFQLFKMGLSKIPKSFLEDNSFIEGIIKNLHVVSIILFVTGIVFMVTGFFKHFNMKNVDRIRFIVNKGLFCYQYGNPLHLKDGECIPIIKCQEVIKGTYDLIIPTTSSSVEEIQKIAPNISSCLNKRYNRYAVTQASADISFNEVVFHLEDVTIDKSITAHSVNDLKGKSPFLIPIQKDVAIDLTVTGSILVCGKTRSGKTTGIIAMLLSVLAWGRDKFQSEVIIIDPKQAELSHLPYVVSVDENGKDKGKSILDAMRRFNDVRIERQKVLNELSDKKGDVVHWWNAEMYPCFLFIDEYIACRNLYPNSKDTTYNLKAFDNALADIATMGSSTACYLIISIAQASATNAGLSTVVKETTKTKLLFKPTEIEGGYIWEKAEFESMNKTRAYKAGDAWFSSDDGEHNLISFVHFPVMQFAVYKELGKLLSAYYDTE